jgi:hypothetical protein
MKEFMMPLEPNILEAIREYMTADLRGEEWHLNYFDFINDPILARRLGEEFISTRYIYKLLEGIAADDWLLRAQVRVQVLSYASIYEAVIHHLFFGVSPDRRQVQELTEFQTKKNISIPKAHQENLQKYLEHDGKEIIPTYEAVGRTDETKVRFDRKAECAFQLGFVTDRLRDDLIEFYEARNSIHIHAEIRKTLEYQLDLSRNAYRRLQPFKEQVCSKLGDLGLLPTGDL